MLQENRAFDNYFGELAAYRVNHQSAHSRRADERRERPPHAAARLPVVQSEQSLLSALSRPNRVHREPVSRLGRGALRHGSGGQGLAQRARRTRNSRWTIFSIVDWSNGVAEITILSTRGRWGTTIRQTCLSTTNWRHSSRPTIIGTPRSPTNTVPNRMYLFSATSHGHAFAPANQDDPAWDAADDFQAPDGPGNFLALLLPGQQRLSGAMGRLERSTRFATMSAIFRSTTTFLPARMPTSCCRKVVFIERATYDRVR